MIRVDAIRNSPPSRFAVLFKAIRAKQSGPVTGITCGSGERTGIGDGTRRTCRTVGLVHQVAVVIPIVFQAINERTRVLVLNSPSNPGGFAYTPDELKAIAEAVVDKDIIVFSDEIYENLVYGDQKFVSFATLAPGLMEKTLTLNGLAKTYSMTGWRIGYAAGPQEIISAMGRLQSHETSNPTTFCMYAAIAALEGDQTCVAKMRDEFAKRAQHMHQRLNSIKGITCIKPVGAFYCFPNVSACYDKLGVKDSVAFADAVLDKINVALVPGIAFGWDTHVRLSFATSTEQIDKGLDRLEKLLA